MSRYEEEEEEEDELPEFLRERRWRLGSAWEGAAWLVLV